MAITCAGWYSEGELAKIGRVANPQTSESLSERRFYVRMNGIELPLRPGTTSIGRGEQCAILLRDRLVSRRHAQFVVEGDSLFIEDLGSANGIFVNQTRSHGRVPLHPGDRVYVGACEMHVGEQAPGVSRPVSAPMHDDTLDRPTPISAIEAVSSAPPPSSEPRTRSSVVPRSDDDPAPDESTTRVEAFDYMARLADRMFTMGRADAAQRILEGRLEEILAKVARHEPVAPELVDSAGRYALKLALETLEPRWVDYTVELHIAAERAMREDVVQQLASLRAKAPLGNLDLLRRYYSLLRSRMALLTPAERLLVERLLCIEPSLEPG